MLSRLLTAVHTEPSGATASPVPLRTPMANGCGRPTAGRDAHDGRPRGVRRRGPRRRCCRWNRSRSRRRRRVRWRRSSARARRRRPGRGFWRPEARRRRCAGWSPLRWRSRRRRPGRSRRRRAWTRRTPGRAAGPARRAGPIGAARRHWAPSRTTCPVLGTDTSSAPSGAHAASLALGTRAHTESRPARRHQRLSRFVEWGLRQVLWYLDGDRRQPRGRLGGGRGRRGRGRRLVRRGAARAPRQQDDADEADPKPLMPRPNPHASPRPESPTARWR